jgi:hypothetical protein
MSLPHINTPMRTRKFHPKSSFFRKRLAKRPEAANDNDLTFRLASDGYLDP